MPPAIPDYLQASEVFIELGAELGSAAIIAGDCALEPGAGEIKVYR